MRKLILGALAAAAAVSPLAPASAQGRTVTTVRETPRGTVVRTRTFRAGERFDRRRAANYRVIDYRPYAGRRLHAPPRGFYWARSGRDAVLVRRSNGVIRRVVPNVF